MSCSKSLEGDGFANSMWCLQAGPALDAITCGLPDHGLSPPEQASQGHEGPEPLGDQSTPWRAETIYHRLELEPICWDSNPAKTHSSWFQGLMKLRSLMSHHRENSVRDKVIGKKWIYSDSERSTLHRQCGPLQRASMGLKYGMVSFYRLGNFIC